MPAALTTKLGPVFHAKIGIALVGVFVLSGGATALEMSATQGNLTQLGSGGDH
jgi:hypothetical protein